MGEIPDEPEPLNPPDFPIKSFNRETTLFLIGPQIRDLFDKDGISLEISHKSSFDDYISYEIRLKGFYENDSVRLFGNLIIHPSDGFRYETGAKVVLTISMDFQPNIDIEGNPKTQKQLLESIIGRTIDGAVADQNISKAQWIEFSNLDGHLKGLESGKLMFETETLGYFDNGLQELAFTQQTSKWGISSSKLITSESIVLSSDSVTEEVDFTVSRS